MGSRLGSACVFFAYHGGRSKLGEQVLVGGLEQAGVDAAPAAQQTEAGPLLLCFDRVDESLLARVRHSSGAGRRVLAVAVPGTTPLGDGAWRLLGAGASDVFAWDDQPRPAELVAARLERWSQVDRLLLLPVVAKRVVGGSEALRIALRRVLEVARFTRSAVLLTGESGTGKELVARLVHELDGRQNRGELVVLDCTTVVPELSGSEFFGHERGAFTHAISARDGAFALADGGTLFLDEVGELPLRLQAELLRVVQEGTFKRVGGNSWRRADFRLVCATNLDLETQMAAGRFRRDLYYRIAAWRCHLPPLAARREDIPELVRHFLAAELGHAPAIDPALMALLVARDYPGNVRDLKHLVSRIAARHVGGGPITLGDLPEEERPRAEALSLVWPDDDLRRSIRRAISLGVGLKKIGVLVADAAVDIAVADEAGNLQRAARRLAVTDRALQLRRQGVAAKPEAATPPIRPRPPRGPPLHR